MKLIRGIFAATLAVAFCVPAAWAQAAPAPTADTIACSDHPYMGQCSNLLPQQIIYLKNVNQQGDANEIVSAMRNVLPPGVTMYLVTGQNAILIHATAEDITRAQKLINELDHPKKNYRLTYTVTEMDGGKQIGTQHYAMVLASGQQTTLKLGNRVPVATGSYSAGVPGNMGPAQMQFTYIDIGMNIDVTLTTMGDGAILKSSVDQSSVAPEKSDTTPQEPIVRQASLRGESFLAPGKSQALGSLDIPGSTSHLQIEVVMEPLP